MGPQSFIYYVYLLKQANSIARRYVSVFGLSDDISLSGKPESTQPFLGKELIGRVKYVVSKNQFFSI